MTFDPEALGAQCSRCPLNQKQPVPPQAPASGKVKLVIVGMNPGRLEERSGIPFFGPSGKMLDRCLEEAGFDRADAWVTNAALCRNDSDQEMKRAVACCAPRLANELASIDKAIPILALGAEATRSVLGKTGVMKSRGFIWHASEIKPGQVSNATRKVEKLRLKEPTEKVKKQLESAEDSLAIISSRQVYSGRVVIPSVHPAFILRGADSWLPVLRIDIDRAVRWSRAPFQLEDEGTFVQTDNPELAKKLLGKMGPLVNVDIETDGNDPMSVGMTCIGVADVGAIERWEKGKIKKIPRSAVVILDPWHKRLIPVLREALRSRTALTHNGPAFDSIALGRLGIRYPRYEDTLLAHYAFASDKPKSLAHVASIYTDTSAWKTRFKQGSEEKGVAGFGVKKEDLAKYNRADVVLGSLAWIRMQSDLNAERKVYEHDKRHALLCQKLQINGILVDVERKKALSKKLRFRSAALLGEMRELLGRRNFSPSKPNDIRRALFQQLKAPTYLAPLTPTGLPAANAVVLEALKGGHNRAAKLADLIIRWRAANDSRSEYLDNVKIGADGRVHPHWRSYGTETGRAATRNPNILNITKMQRCPGCGLQLIDGMVHKETCKPKKRKDPQPEDQLRDIYIASPGHVFIYFDLSQCEMRFAANLSGDEAFIQACETDIHTGNARLLFRAVPGALEDLKDPKGAGFRFRDLAKKCGFCISYLGEAEKLFKTLLENGFDVEIDVCQDAIDAIHSTYWRYFQYVDENVALCQRQGYLRTAFLGRKRWLGFHPKPTEVSAFPISAGVADIMNYRLGVIDDRMSRRIRQVMYQYDSAIYETPENLVDKQMAIIKDVWSEKIRVPDNGIEFMQPIEAKTGRRLSDFG
jgi:uracil-DNA glycosylase family 4